MLSSLIGQLPSALSNVLENVSHSIGSAVSEVALNPQPLPPKEIGGLFSDSFDVAALNPQPLPPIEIGGLFSNSFDVAALNPQPLPPKEIGGLFTDSFDVAALNPQPLPPKEIGDLFTDSFDVAALNPQPLPPKEIGDLFTDSFDVAALNPQPLPPKEIGAFEFDRADLFGAEASPSRSSLFPETTEGGFAPETFPDESGFEEDFSDLLEDFEDGELLPARPEQPEPEAESFAGSAVLLPDPDTSAPFPADRDFDPGFEPYIPSETAELPALPEIRVQDLIEPALMF